VVDASGRCDGGPHGDQPLVEVLPHAERSTSASTHGGTGGGAGANCYDANIHIEVTYDPNPSDPATSTFRLDAPHTGALQARNVSAPNFIEARYTAKWVFDVDDPGQTAGPYRLPK
jgi:hypothetical protein